MNNTEDIEDDVIFHYLNPDDIQKEITNADIVAIRTSYDEEFKDKLKCIMVIRKGSSDCEHKRITAKTLLNEPKTNYEDAMGRCDYCKAEWFCRWKFDVD